MEDSITAGLSSLTFADALDGVPRRVTGWAVRRRVAPVSVSGISLALGVCAAVWFSAGTFSGNVVGAVALCGSYLASRGARQLAATTAAVTQPRYAAARRVAAVCDGVTEYAGYAGLALGGLAAHGRDMWQLATAVMILLAALKLILRSGARYAPDTVAARILGVLGLPAGGRVLLVAVAVPVWGARAALLYLLGWGIVGIGYALTAPRHGSASRPPGEFRDDGPIAVRLGQLVRGQLVPLPAALLGLAASAVLVVMGLRNLASVLVLTPLVVLLLAAPGSSHRHDGRLDWLVPGVLQAAQLLYIAALGFGFGVPGPLTYALCAVIALWYTAAGPRPAGQREPVARSGLGWEGRMLVAGLAAMLGIATFGYVVFAAYLAVLSYSRIRASYLMGAGGSAPVTASGRRLAAGVRR
jgi:Family of unknown function (DUF5941)